MAETIDIVTVAIALAAFLLSIVAASYSSRLASAGEESAKAARASADKARSMRDLSEEPEFNIVAHPPQGKVWPIEIKMVSGPPSVQVELTFLGETTKNGFGHFIGLALPHRFQAAENPVFVAHIESIDGATKNSGRLILECEEEGVEQPRKWPKVREVRWPETASQILGESSPGL